MTRGTNNVQLTATRSLAHASMTAITGNAHTVLHKALARLYRARPLTLEALIVFEQVDNLHTPFTRHMTSQSREHDLCGLLSHIVPLIFVVLNVLKGAQRLNGVDVLLALLRHTFTAAFDEIVEQHQ